MIRKSQQSPNNENKPKTESLVGTAINVALLTQFNQWLEHHNYDSLKKALSDLHSADIADLFIQLSAENRKLLADYMAPAFDAEILTYLDPSVKDQLVAILSPRDIAESVARLHSDDAIELVEDLNESAKEEIISYLPVASRQVVEEGLTFPEDSAGRLMQREFVAAPEFWTIEELFAYVRKDDTLPEDFYSVFIIDPSHKILGYIPISHLLKSHNKVILRDLIMPDVHKIRFDEDQEDVAYLFRHYNLISAPVVDDAERLIGVITVDDIVDVIDEEAEEDFLSAVGMGSVDFHANTFSTALNRIRWLLLLLANTILSSIVINHFKGTINEAVILAVLMPIVTSMGGNAGIQVVTVTVRAIATRDIRPNNVKKIILKELTIALINGLVFATIAGSLATLWFHNFLVGGILATAIGLNLLWAGLAGIMIPLILARLKIDPAVTAAPILTTTTDVLGFFLFLGLATLLMVH